MAVISFSVQIHGAGQLQLPVEIGGPYEIADLGQVTVPFTVSNPLEREVTFPAVTVALEGPAKDKVTATLTLNAVSIPAAGAAENSLIVEAKEPLIEGDAVMVTVTGEEG